ncbi:hypothetical protein [Mesorhizobium muleiense]|uniref:hypothetical protein n=1 Tax=Mesorhizobium muleiense TaxID=1004279 RepID=UPI0039B0C929
MLGVAAAKLEERPEVADRVRLVEGDMTNFDLGQRFALTIIPARSFQHVVTPAGQRETLRCVRRHLMSGGHLILDLFDPNFELLFENDSTNLPSREARHPRSGHLVRRTVVARHSDPLRQTVQEILRFEELDPAGKVLAREETSWTLRWSMRQEIAYLLELCGFEPVDLFSDFKGSSPDLRPGTALGRARDLMGSNGCGRPTFVDKKTSPSQRRIQTGRWLNVTGSPGCLGGRLRRARSAQSGGSDSPC